MQPTVDFKIWHIEIVKLCSVHLSPKLWQVVEVFSGWIEVIEGKRQVLDNKIEWGGTRQSKKDKGHTTEGTFRG